MIVSTPYQHTLSILTHAHFLYTLGPSITSYLSNNYLFPANHNHNHNHNHLHLLTNFALTSPYQELERLLHCDGIWLHALKYQGNPFDFLMLIARNATDPLDMFFQCFLHARKYFDHSLPT